MCHPKPQMPLVELGFSGFSSRKVERRRRILKHTWRLTTVFIILISFRISFPTGNLELKTSVCDSLLWCRDLFQQPAAAWVAWGRGGLAVAGVCAWTWCFSAQLLGWVSLCTSNTSIPLPWWCWGSAICSPAACILLPALQVLPTAVVVADFRASEVVSFPCLSFSFHGFVPAKPDMVIMYFRRRQLPLAWVCHLISPFSLSLIL